MTGSSDCGIRIVSSFHSRRAARNSHPFPCLSFPSGDDPLDADAGALMVQEYKGQHAQPVQDVSLATDGTRFVSCGGDKPVFMWDTATARCVRKFYGHDAHVNSVCYNADGTVVASASYDGTVRLWDCKSNNGHPITVLPVFRDSVTKVLTTDHEIIASSVDNCVRVFDLRAGKLRVDDVHGEACACLSMCLCACVRFKSDVVACVTFLSCVCRSHSQPLCRLSPCPMTATACC